MPRFRIQSNLHLDGFQMLDACLENVTSFEGLDDRNTGRIVFLNGSSSNQSYLHPAVYDGIGFKGLAYLDDIDKITNGEGSLGMRVKALEDMLGLQDVTDVIDTWNDVKEFFKDVDEGLDLMTMLNGKLDTKGGTITGQLTVDQRLIMKSLVQFNQYGGTNEYLLGMTDNNGILRWYNGSSWNTLLHAGNVEEYKAGDSAKLDGLSVTSFVRSYADVGANSKTGNWLGYTYTTEAHGGAATGGVISFGSTAYGAQINGGIDGSSLFYRGYSPSGFTDWKTIAFTDAVLLLDGSNTMTGNLKMTEGKAILWGSANLLQYTTSKFIIGRSASIDERTTEIHGYPIIFRYGNDEGTAMTITDGGRVVVGTDASVDGDKLYSRGRVNILSLCNNPTLGNMPESGLVMTDNRSTLGIAQWVSNGTGAGNIQATRFDGTATAYALNLNPLGGAVNVGEGGLNVAGGIKSGDKFNLTTSSMNLGSATTPLYLFLARPDANYIWASANGGYINLGVYDSGTTNSANATLSIYSDRVVSGQRNNAVSLGTSSYRWSNVYSVGGNFSGSVLIGGAEEDGTSALQVGGTIAFGQQGYRYGYILGTSLGVEFLGAANEFLFEAGTKDFIYINYRKSSRGYAPKTWNWQAGSSTAYADFVLGHATFNGGALIPTGQKLTIGDANGDHATIEYDSIAKAIKVDGNLFTTGTNASGGKADAQQGGTGGNAEVYRHDLDWGEQVYEIQNVKGDVNVNVQVYEWNENGNSWDMILTDVSVTANIITVTFGRPTSVDHMVTVV